MQAQWVHPRLQGFEPAYASISPDDDQPLIGSMRQRAFLADDGQFVFEAVAQSALLADRLGTSTPGELRPLPFAVELLDDASFEFSDLGLSPASGAATGGGQRSEYSWMDMADASSPDIHGAVPAFDGPGDGAETGMLDYRMPEDMFQDGAQLSLDGMAALGPDVFRIG